jgi:hypothetical protein
MTDALVLNDAEALTNYYESEGAEWLMLVTHYGNPYILSCSGLGDVFVQTLQEEGDRGAYLLANVPGGFYPVRVVSTDGETPVAKIAHGYLPVAGHADDPECAHRADGTDATYCGRGEDEHAWSTR